MRAAGLLVLGAIAGVAFAQGDAIYRCDDGAGGVLYANVRCPGGRALELPESRPDPAARERLRQDLEAFERRQAARAAALRDRQRQDELRQRTASESARADEPPAYAPPSAFYAPLYAAPLPRPIKPRSRPPRTTPAFVPAR